MKKCYRCGTEYPSNKFCPICYSEGFDALRLRTEENKAVVDLLRRSSLQPRLKRTRLHGEVWD